MQQVMKRVCCVLLITLIIPLWTSGAEGAKHPPTATDDQSMYEGVFALDGAQIGYIQGPFPRWLNPDPDRDVWSRSYAKSMPTPSQWSDCEDCFDCCCFGVRCYDWCDSCRSRFWFDCPHRDEKKCVCNLTLNCPMMPVQEDQCEFDRALLPGGSARPQSDVSQFVNDNPDGRALIQFNKLTTPRLVHYIVYNITAVVLRSPTIVEFDTGDPNLNPIYRRVLNCSPAQLPCTLRICEVETYPSLTLSFSPGTDPLTIRIIEGDVRCTGEVEVGHST